MNNSNIHIRLFVSILFIATYIANAQTEYPYWGDEYFEGKNDTLKTELDNQKVLFETSTGFFPKPLHNWQFNWELRSQPWGDWSEGSMNINRQYSFIPHIFSTQPPNMDDFDDNIEEKKSFSGDDKYGFWDNEEDPYSYWGLSFEYSVPNLHTIFSVSAGYLRQKLLFYSPIYTKYFLGYYGEKRSFEECAILEMLDKSIYASIDFRHPIYGGLMRTQDTRIFSFYYLTYGIGCNFSISDRLSLDNYIVTANDDLRYSNGEIRENVFSKEIYNGVTKYRYNYNFGIGYQFAIDDFAGFFELKYTGSINSLIENHKIKLQTLSLNTGVDLKLPISIIKWLLKL